MFEIRCLVAAFGLVATAAATAQSPAPAERVAPSASGSLERAQRLAASPMRMILEAGRIKPRRAEATAGTATPAGEAAGVAPPVAAEPIAARRRVPAPAPTPATATVPDDAGIVTIVQMPAELPLPRGWRGAADAAAPPSVPPLQPLRARPVRLDRLDALPASGETEADGDNEVPPLRTVRLRPPGSEAAPADRLAAADRVGR